MGLPTAWLATRHTKWREDRLVCVCHFFLSVDMGREELWGQLLSGWQLGPHQDLAASLLKRVGRWLVS